MEDIKILKQTGLAKDAIDNPKKYNGFFGVSLRNRSFTKELITQYLKIGTSLFKEFYIFLIDKPDRHNLMINQGIDEQEALKKVNVISENMKNAFTKVINSFNLENVHFLRYGDLYKMKGYKEFEKRMNKEVENNNILKEIVYKEMVDNIGKRIENIQTEKNLNSQELKQTKNKLIKYAIEETTSFFYITENLCKIEIDLHDELLLKEYAYDKKLPEFKEMFNLTERGYIKIKFKDN